MRSFSGAAMLSVQTDSTQLMGLMMDGFSRRVCRNIFSVSPNTFGIHLLFDTPDRVDG